MTADLRSQARDALFSRAESARAFLNLVEDKTIPVGDVPDAQLRRIAMHNDSHLDALVRKHWGNIQPGTPEQKLAMMRRFNNDLRVGGGNSSRGKVLFTKHCATCHQLFGEGTKLGPDLTGANRRDRDALLANLVDPSAVIRREYLSSIVATKSGRILTGLIAEQDAASITIADAKNNRMRLSRDTIETLKDSDVSLMPEKLLEQLSPQEVRDLFSYLQK